MEYAFLQGFLLCGGMIIAIGAQNAFLLSQSIRRNHHYTVAAMCCLGDIILVGTGVAGVGTIVVENPALMGLATWGGAAFLLWYGVGALRSALKPGSLKAGSDDRMPLKKVVLTTLAVTFLNPHAYLDTVVVVGSISAQFGEARYVFGAGAVLASFVWFITLSTSGRLLAPVFAKPSAWRALDLGIAAVMFFIAAGLIHKGFSSVAHAALF